MELHLNDVFVQNGQTLVKNGAAVIEFLETPAATTKPDTHLQKHKCVADERCNDPENPCTRCIGLVLTCCYVKKVIGSCAGAWKCP